MFRSFFSQLTKCLPIERKCSFFATKHSRLDAYKNRKVVRWCRTLASSHNSQGVVDGRVNVVGENTTAPYRSAVLCYLMDQGKGGYSQHCCSSTPARSSKPPQECDA